MQENLTIFARKFEGFCRKMLQLLCGKLIIFTEKFDGICKKIVRFFQENLSISKGKFDDFVEKFNAFSERIRRMQHGPFHRTNISKLNFTSGRTGRTAGPASSTLVKLSLKPF